MYSPHVDLRKDHLLRGVVVAAQRRAAPELETVAPKYQVAHGGALSVLVRSMRNMVSSSELILIPISVLFGLTFPLYIVAWLALIVLAFISLRDLPEHAFLTID